METKRERKRNGEKDLETSEMDSQQSGSEPQANRQEAKGKVKKADETAGNRKVKRAAAEM